MTLSPFASLAFPESKASSAGARAAAEANALLAKVPSSYTLICLDPAGKMQSSEGFAQSVAKFRDGGAAGLAFLIGGADGLGQAARDKADLVLSLGPMTLLHGLGRIVLSAAPCRGRSKLAGPPYRRA